MATIPEALAIAVQHHQAGRLQAAEQIYRQILQMNPNQADAHNNLGVALKDQRRLEDSVACFRRAVALRPDFAEAHVNLGAAFKEQGKPDDAVACFRRALALRPEFAEAHFSLGNAFAEAGKAEEAIACFRRVLEQRPGFAEAYVNLGNAFRDHGEPDQEIACFRRALELKPDLAGAHRSLGLALMSRQKPVEAAVCFAKALELQPGQADAHVNFGNALMEQGKLDAAAVCFRRACALKPDLAGAHNNLGIALMRQGKLDDAAACFRRALELKPDFVGAYCNLGLALIEEGRLADAIACCRRALELDPSAPEAHNSLGLVLMDERKMDEAAACFRRAAELKRGFIEAHNNLALALLLVGQFEQGWIEYESRISLGASRNLSTPRWNQELIEGQTILLHCERGFGDSLCFVRYAALVRERARAQRVILESPPELARLFAHSLHREMEIVVRGPGDGAPPHDCHLPLMSLPLALKIIEPWPMSEPYLRADHELRAVWRKRLGPRAAFRVGLVWAGRRGFPGLRLRSIDSPRLLPLLLRTGASFYHFALGAADSELRPLTDAGLIDLTGRIHDFADTAALMAELDLIISVDTAAAHLAGSLGLPVWTLLKFAADWRWGMVGESTPWYPTMRLFRQPKPGDWDSVLHTIAEELEKWVRTRPEDAR